jgi:hypothetical protein
MESFMREHLDPRARSKNRSPTLIAAVAGAQQLVSPQVAGQQKKNNRR